MLACSTLVMLHCSRCYLTYVVGEPFDPAEPRGLELSDLGAWLLGALGAETRVSRGDVFEGAISTYVLRSWGAGEGAIAMAVLMLSDEF